jgi:hypothetical protein
MGWRASAKRAVGQVRAGAMVEEAQTFTFRPNSEAITRVFMRTHISM